MTTYASDSFNRVDSSSSLGIAQTGQTWIPQAGTWGITASQAYVAVGASDSQNTIVMETGVSDCEVGVTINVTGNNGVCFRSTDNGNHWLWENGGGALFKRVNGTYTQVGRYARNETTTDGQNGDVIRVLLEGPIITVIRNGLTVVRVSDSFNQMATRHGLRQYTASTAAGRLDNFVVKSLSSPLSADTPYAASVINDRPLGYWRMNAPSGSTIVPDDSGRIISYPATMGTNMTLGHPGLLPAPNDAGSIRFNASHNGLNVATGPPLLGSFSVEAWVRMDGDNGARQDIMSYGEAEGTGFVFAAREAGGVGPRMYVNHSGSWPSHTSATIPANGVPTYLVYTYDALNRFGAMYINANLVVSGVLSGSAQNLPGGNATIGARDSRDTHQLVGYMDEVALYGFPLLPQDITNRYAIREKIGGVRLWTDAGSDSAMVMG